MVRGAVTNAAVPLSFGAARVRSRKRCKIAFHAMLLALDVGNTNITVGLFEGSELRHRWRLRTIHEQTADEWGVLVRNLFALSRIQESSVSGIVVSSVVPPVDGPLAQMARRYFGMDALFVNSTTEAGITIRYDNPKEVGADRVVNAVAAFSKYGGPCVVVDLGTAITFDAVSAKAEYLGGIICPGIGIAIAGLFQKAARLPMVDFREPARLVGTNTVDSIQSGLYWGYISLIDGLVEKIMGELGPDTKAVATGGQAALIQRGSKFLKHVDEDLTLEGLRIIWDRTRPR